MEFLPDGGERTRLADTFRVARLVIDASNYARSDVFELHPINHGVDINLMHGDHVVGEEILICEDGHPLLKPIPDNLSHEGAEHIFGGPGPSPEKHDFRMIGDVSSRRPPVVLDDRIGVSEVGLAASLELFLFQPPRYAKLEGQPGPLVGLKREVSDLSAPLGLPPSLARIEDRHAESKQPNEVENGLVDGKVKRSFSGDQFPRLKPQGFLVTILAALTLGAGVLLGLASESMGGIDPRHANRQKRVEA